MQQHEQKDSTNENASQKKRVLVEKCANLNKTNLIKKVLLSAKKKALKSKAAVGEGATFDIRKPEDTSVAEGIRTTNIKRSTN